MRAFTVLFDQEQDADDARQQLMNAGISAGDIQVTRADELAPEGEGKHEHKGFVQRLKDLFSPADHHLHPEGVPRGSALLTVWARKGQEDRALQILRGARAAPRRASRRNRSRLRPSSDPGGGSPMP